MNSILQAIQFADKKDFTAIEGLYFEHFHRLILEVRGIMERQNREGIVFASGSRQYFHADDQYIPWKMPATLRHFISEELGAHAFFLLTANSAEVFLYQPNDYWYAPPKLPVGAWTHWVDLHVFHDLSALKRTLQLRLNDKMVWIGPEDHEVELGLVKNVEEMLFQLHELRVCKSPYEIALLRLANIDALQAHTAAEQAFYAGESELDIHLTYLQALRVAEENLPYHNIVALNHHAAVLHYQYFSTTSPAKKYSFLLDAGAEYLGYAADLTRTYAGNEAPEVYRALITGMRTLKHSMLSYYREGVDHVSLHEQAHHKIALLLNELEVIQEIDAAEAVEIGLTRLFFPHGIGHLLGLQVHDAGGFQNAVGVLPRHPVHSSLRCVRELQKGMVLTVEPGIYCIESLLESATSAQKQHLNQSLIEMLMPCGGVRDEDNIVVGNEGGINLTT